MHPQGRVRQGNTREAKTKTCKLEVGKLLEKIPLTSGEPFIFQCVTQGVKQRREIKGRKCRRKMSTRACEISKKAQRRKEKHKKQKGGMGKKVPD